MQFLSKDINPTLSTPTKLNAEQHKQHHSLECYNFYWKMFDINNLFSETVCRGDYLYDKYIACLTTYSKQIYSVRELVLNLVLPLWYEYWGN